MQPAVGRGRHRPAGEDAGVQPGEEDLGEGRPQGMEFDCSVE